MPVAVPVPRGAVASPVCVQVAPLYAISMLPAARQPHRGLPDPVWCGRVCMRVVVATGEVW